jgi:hypothetical protein
MSEPPGPTCCVARAIDAAQLHCDCAKFPLPYFGILSDVFRDDSHGRLSNDAGKFARNARSSEELVMKTALIDQLATATLAKWRWSDERGG